MCPVRLTCGVAAAANLAGIFLAVKMLARAVDPVMAAVIAVMLVLTCAAALMCTFLALEFE